MLDIGDVLGKRIVHTGERGRITVAERNAAAAIEVMSRFAVDPRWLVYLPPTMSPVAASERTGLLEHPAEAFTAYRSAGVDTVICEEKHMGSRCVIMVCAGERDSADRFGVDDGSTGAVYTRTGRPFFGPELTDRLLARLRGALVSSGVFDELASGWVLLDAELLPWSAKAEDLVRDQYATVGAAARAALPAAIQALEQAAAGGRDVGALLDSVRSREANAHAFTEAYRRYCWPVSGLDGIKLAPFQVLAAVKATFHDRDHRWHLRFADRLAAADPELFVATRNLMASTNEAADEQQVAAWWEELTGAGAEGMVVKPLANYVRGPRGLVQPGLKVRGRDYLRIIYGPDYTDAANLVRLRGRGLGTKRSLAAREYALGLEALDRLVGGEPLWRVHECVFAVLALESRASARPPAVDRTRDGVTHARRAPRPGLSGRLRWLGLRRGPAARRASVLMVTFVATMCSLVLTLVVLPWGSGHTPSAAALGWGVAALSWRDVRCTRPVSRLPPRCVQRRRPDQRGQRGGTVDHRRHSARRASSGAVAGRDSGGPPGHRSRIAHRGPARTDL